MTAPAVPVVEVQESSPLYILVSNNVPLGFRKTFFNLLEPLLKVLPDS
jgi:hypothetical protein